MGEMVGTASLVDAAMARLHGPVDNRSTPFTGAALQAYHRTIRGHGVQLLALHDGEIARLLQDVLNSVDCCLPRVLVVGQDCAGKTTLVNKLIRRPGFLPSGPQANTGAVTNLHFSLPSGPRQGAKVTFLSREEGRTRAAQRSLEQRLLDAAACFNHRPDPGGGRLFGTTIEWTEALRDTTKLTSYLTTAPEQLARLVRSVDIYFDASPFPHPITIVDTPALVGHWATGDGALDVIGSVDTVDACIVVLKAAAEVADLRIDPALLAILRRIPKDRIIVYVNDISAQECDGMVNQQALVRGQRTRAKILERLLRQKLHQELTVITGSRDDELATELHENMPVTHLAVDNADLIREISCRTLNGPFVRHLANAASVLRDVAEAREASARSNLFSISNRILDIHKDRAAKEVTFQHIQELIQEIRQLCERIEQSCNMASASIRDLQGEGESAVRQILDRQLNTFLTAKSGQLRSALRNHKESEWRCDTDDWRREFEDEASNLYRDVRLKLIGILRTSVEDFRRAVKLALPDALEGFDVAQPAANFHLPAIEVLTDPVVLKLDHRSWSSWFKPQQTPANVLAEFKKLLSSEFDKAYRATVEQIKQGIAKDGAAVLYRITQKSITIIGMMIERRDQLVKAADNLIALHQDSNVDRLLAVHVLEQYQAERVALFASEIKTALDELMGAASAPFADARQSA